MMTMSPDTRQHRGPHPADKQLFSDQQLPALHSAAGDLSWLLTRAYSLKSSLKLVGDRYNLKERQRLAISRAACSDSQLEHRRASRIPIDKIRDESLVIDGFNLLITIEAALSGGLLIVGRDECIRDLSGVHGSYRSVIETEQAICLVGRALEEIGVGESLWFLDKPVSNSGRLGDRIRKLAAQHSWPWEVELAFNPDAEILTSARIAVSSDSVILDRATSWAELNSHIIRLYLSRAWIVDLRPHSATGASVLEKM
jgi:hypothetical protein